MERCGVVHTLLHESQRFTAVFFHLFDDRNNELYVHIGDLLDLFGIKFLGLRSFHTLMHIFADLVLADLVGKRALGSIDRAFIRESLLQAD